MRLEDYSDDEIVSDMQRRLDLGTVGWFGLASTDQQDYRGLWWQFTQWLHDRRNSSHAEFQRLSDVQQQVNNLMNDGKLSAPPPVAINTTLLGREHEATK